MADPKGNKGVVLFIVLMTLFIVVILANIMLQIMSSQSRLTHHQLSRMQAYYAGFGAGNYAYDKIRRGEWPMPAAGTSYIRRICRTTGAGCNVIEPSLPVSIQSVTITVSSRGVNSCNPPASPTPAYCITSFTDYTYTP